eukprot:CAMPEP_0170483596 /NCGR_PEP_ID=MMETSP0208-20121228/3269_1 /TAXON_ID=197538 /ORGANISM="Strombidium inclinatum, Strain S3" /LENGTH=68 /DNA_ID=CAMNT_0010756709 /DNA_START=27 /DNA_END=233 /DNA_ORIENTATION=-
MNKEGISAHLSESLSDDIEAENNDRELIAAFLDFVHEVQDSIGQMEKNNEEMQGLVQELITDKKSSQN